MSPFASESLVSTLKVTDEPAVTVALAVSVSLLLLVLVWQFAHLFKPLIVFAAVLKLGQIMGAQ